MLLICISLVDPTIVLVCQVSYRSAKRHGTILAYSIFPRLKFTEKSTETFHEAMNEVLQKCTSYFFLFCFANQSKKDMKRKALVNRCQ